MMLRSGSLSLAISPQFTAFFTSALILASSVAVNCFSAKAVGHMAPSSRFAMSLKPNVAYLVLNFSALWKKQTTLPSLAYAGIPYQVLGERAGALALMMAWSRLAMARSGSCIAAIFASTSPSPSALFLLPRSSAFSSWARSFIAARSSSVNPLDVLLITVALLADFCVSFFGLMETSLRGLFHPVRLLLDIACTTQRGLQLGGVDGLGRVAAAARCRAARRQPAISLGGRLPRVDLRAALLDQGVRRFDAVGGLNEMTSRS